MTRREEQRERCLQNDEQVARAALVARLRTLSWPTPEPGEARRAFEAFTARLEDSSSSLDDC